MPSTGALLASPLCVCTCVHICFSGSNFSSGLFGLKILSINSKSPLGTPLGTAANMAAPPPLRPVALLRSCPNNPFPADAPLSPAAHTGNTGAVVGRLGGQAHLLTLGNWGYDLIGRGSLRSWRFSETLTSLTPFSYLLFYESPAPGFPPKTTYLFTKGGIW